MEEPTWIWVLRMKIWLYAKRLRHMPAKVNHCDSCWQPTLESKMFDFKLNTGKTVRQCEFCHFLMITLKRVHTQGRFHESRHRRTRSSEVHREN